MNQSDDKTPAERLSNAAATAAAAKQEPESQLWSGGYAARAMLGTWVMCGVLSIVLIAALFFLPGLLGDGVDKRWIWGICFGVIAAVWLMAGITYLHRRLSVHYQLTSQRLIHKHGILIRTSDRIELIDINDVAYTQGIFERMINVGSIRISSNDRSHPELKLIGIQDVSKVAGLIDDARRQERRKRALHMA